LTPTAETDGVVVLGLLSHQDYIDLSGELRIVGEARNESSANLDHVSARIMFYNRWGTVMRIVHVPALLDVVDPGQLVPFVVSLAEPAGWERYTVRVTAQQTLRQTASGLQIAAHQTEGLHSGILHVTGTVANRGDGAMPRAKVVVTLYDPWGTVVNAGYAYTERIPAGGEAAFDCQFVDYELVEEVAVQVEPG
jgi:hypothetical protein